MLESLPSIDPSAVSPALLFLIFVGVTFISEDAACLTAGALAGQGRIGFAFAVLACLTGIVIGDLLLYGVGRIFGTKITGSTLFARFISEQTMRRAAAWLEKRGASAIFISRFVTGLRLPAYLASGFFRLNALKFSLYVILSALIWTPLLVGSAAFSQKIFSVNLIFSVAASLIAMKLLTKLYSRKSRRLLIGKLKRIVTPEFWPIYVFYLPVVVHILVLGIKHRSFTAFTAANPAMPAGGFVGESKNDIYRALQNDEGNADLLLPYLLLKCEHSLVLKIRQIWQFIDDNNLSFPLVLKPDAGERGKGVRIVKTFDDLRNELRKSAIDLILQKFSPGVEASIFYYRYPDQKSGQIFSITEKQFPKLIGDGVSTLETLILRDKRAVCPAQKYFEQNSERLNSVPAQGEEVQIIDIGTHSRGAMFLDGGWLKTKELEEKIDEICRGYQGFYFGRFDIRAGSFADLMEGKNFKIIELNGVTSESTNIYDMRYNLIDMYRILFRQWRIAFEIGAENIRLGAKQTSLIELFRLVFGKNKNAQDALTNNRHLSTESC